LRLPVKKNKNGGWKRRDPKNHPPLCKPGDYNQTLLPDYLRGPVDGEEGINHPPKLKLTDSLVANL
jgi:hypothetical protein